MNQVYQQSSAWVFGAGPGEGAVCITLYRGLTTDCLRWEAGYPPRVESGGESTPGTLGHPRCHS